jgi:hypothetical protein
MLIYRGEATGSEMAEFVGRVRLANGTFKTTAPHRLDDVNGVVSALLPRDRRLKLMDVAVSLGTATVEWSEQLDAPHSIVAGDLCIAVKWSRLGFANVLRYDRIVWADAFGRAIDVFGGTPRSRFALPWLEFLSRVVPSRTVPLVDPRLTRSKTITLIEDDIFVARPEFEGRFDAVRAANILNRSYFDQDQLREGVANLIDRVRHGGLLVICRTDEEGMNHASVYRLSGQVEEVARLGDGSEVHDLVVSARTR